MVSSNRTSQSNVEHNRRGIKMSELAKFKEGDVIKNKNGLEGTVEVALGRGMHDGNVFFEQEQYTVKIGDKKWQIWLESDLE